MDAAEQLKHNHGHDHPPVEGRNQLNWCATCGDWFVPLTAKQREFLSELEDAKSTIRFALEGGLAKAGASLGLNCVNSASLLDAMMNELLDPQYAWAIRKLAGI